MLSWKVGGQSAIGWPRAAPPECEDRGFRSPLHKWRRLQHHSPVFVRFSSAMILCEWAPLALIVVCTVYTSSGVAARRATFAVWSLQGRTAGTPVK